MNDLTKVDFHSHTYYSILRIPKLRGEHYFQDSAISPKLLVKVAQRRKLGAIALTDHDTMQGMKPFLYYASKYSKITPIVGQEITKYNQKRKAWAHVLTYGLRNISKRIRYKPLPEFLEYLDDNNAVYVLAHPFDLTQSAPAGGYNQKTNTINFSVLKRFRMVEVVNGLQPKRHNSLTQVIANELGLPGIAGGDSHQPKMIGRCFTYVEGTTEEEIIEYLRNVKKSPAKYNLQTHGTGSYQQVWEDWFHFLMINLRYNIRYDIYRHYHPDVKIGSANPVYDRLHYDTPMFAKIMVQAGLPYVFWAVIAGLKILIPRLMKQSKIREVEILKSLVTYHDENKNREELFLDIPFSEEESVIFKRF
ncbi:MAG: PHP domain-containing protein [Candidatus Hodarchaeota archaeon]